MTTIVEFEGKVLKMNASVNSEDKAFGYWLLKTYPDHFRQGDTFVGMAKKVINNLQFEINMVNK